MLKNKVAYFSSGHRIYIYIYIYISGLEIAISYWGGEILKFMILLKTLGGRNDNLAPLNSYWGGEEYYILRTPLSVQEKKFEGGGRVGGYTGSDGDRKSTRLNSSHP